MYWIQKKKKEKFQEQLSLGGGIVNDFFAFSLFWLFLNFGIISIILG